VTIDLLRWGRGLWSGGVDRRAQMARRIRVHLTGRAPAVAERQASGRAKGMRVSYAMESTVERSTERLRNSGPE
jgi:hypothetical protein